MTERRRTYRRGTRKNATDDQPSPESLEQPTAEANPYLDISAEPPAKPRPKRTIRSKRVAKPSEDSGVDAPPPPPSPAPQPTLEFSFDAPASKPPSTPAPTPAPAADVTPPSYDQAPPQSSDSTVRFDETPYSNRNGSRDGNRDGSREGVRDGNRGRYRRFRHRKQGADGNQEAQSNHGNPNQQGGNPRQQHGGGHHQQNRHNGNNNYAGRRQQRRRFDNTPRGPIGPVTVEGEATGWFDPHRDSGFIRSPSHSYLADPSDPFVSMQLVRQYGLRRGDLITASVGRDQRNRIVVADILSINETDPANAERRPEFQSLIASYPERKLTLETGKPAKGGPELTRRAIDLIAPIGYGQRALIVAPARAGKTMLLQAVIEGISINHPEAALFVLLVDERPEEVSDMITLGHGEVIASSFDMPAARHTDVAEMTLERARRLVELGRDVVIVLDSITRLARAYNTVERGTGRTLSGGLDSSAMAKPKAFFGSARAVSEQHGGGSLTIIATALVETGSRMDDVIFEEFKGTGNCEIKLDRSLAEKRIFPAIDIPISGTRREDKLFRPDQLEHVYTLRRGLQQMPSSGAMEWLIKRIAGTTNNDALLSGL